MRKIALMIFLGFGFAVLPAVAQDDDIIEYVEEVEYDDSAEGASDESVSVTNDESSEVSESSDKTSQSAEITEVTSESTQDSSEVAESSEISDETKEEVASDESMTEATETAEVSDETSEEVAEVDTEATAEVAESSAETTTEETTEDAQLEVLDEEEFANGDDSEYVDSEEVVEAESIDDYDNSLGSEPDYTYSTSDDKSDITRWNYTEKEIIKKEKIRQRQAEREAEYEKSISRRRSGLFFGVGMGFSDTTIKGLANSFASGFLSGGGDGMSVMGIGVGAFAGWQVAFNEYAGVRMYGEFDYNLGKGIILAKVGDESIKADNNLWKALGNVDFYLEGSMGRNQTETLGFFFGLGAGYIFYKGGKGKKDGGGDVTWKSLHMIGFVVNYGIHTILGTNHRIELFVRNYPFMRVEAEKTYTNSDFTANMDAWLRYSYMF